MNILYTITSYPPSMGGAQLYLHEIAKRAVREHNVEVVSFFDVNRNDWLLGTTLRSLEKDNLYTYENVKVRQISFSRSEKLKMLHNIFTYYLNKKHNINVISKLIEKKLNQVNFKIDLVHNVRVGREPLSYASLNLARHLKVPFIFTPLHHPKWDHWFFKEYHDLYRKADCLFALTSYEKEVYKRLGVKEDNISVTGTGPVISSEAYPERFRKKHNLTGYLILFIGQGYKYKGIIQLLKAAKIVFEHEKDANFIFIGPHTEYSKGLFRRQNDARIKHIDKVDLQTKTDALAACDIFCLPSSQESFGAVFLEAWCFEKPVIGMDIPQLRCLIQDGANGYLVSSNPENIAKRILDLLKDAGLRKRLGACGKKTVENNFTWDILYNKTVADYRRILKKVRDQKDEKSIV